MSHNNNCVASIDSFHLALLPDPQKKDIDEIARKSHSRAACFSESCGIFHG